MAWDTRDDIRSAYILSMVHQRDVGNAKIDGNVCMDANNSRLTNEIGYKTSEQHLRKKEVLFDSSHSFNPNNSHSEHLISVTNINNREITPRSSSETSSRRLRCQTNNAGINRKREESPKITLSENIRFKTEPSSTFEMPSPDKYPNCNYSTDETIQMVTSANTIKTEADENSSSENQNCEKSLMTTDAKSVVRREYQLLAQKFHQYTINCRSTIRTLERKLKKLVDDKHALLHGMVSMRKSQKDVIKKYRKIFNDAMNEHCNEINALLANYKIIRDNYLELLQQEASPNGSNRHEEVLSVSYTSYNCC